MNQPAKEQKQQQLQYLPLDSIYLSQTESQASRREAFDKDGLAELAADIRAHGVLQPIIVNRQTALPISISGINEQDKLEIIAGERRYLAATQAGLQYIPAIVHEGLSQEEVISIQLAENLQREGLHPMHEAEGYEQLLQLHGRDYIEELHHRVGKSKSYVYGRIKLLELTPKARKAYYEGKILDSVALMLARIPSPKIQDEALKDLVDSETLASKEYARHIIQDDYMLQLKNAPFDITDAKLLPTASACNTCPKRTGNQPELFADIKGNDICTDKVCYQAKVKAHGKALAKNAKAEGREVIQGKAAKEVKPYLYGGLRGYQELDGTTYVNHKAKKIKSILPADVKPAVFIDPYSGEACEVVPQKIVHAAVRKLENAGKPKSAATKKEESQATKQKREKAFRLVLYRQLRPLLPIPDMRAIARQLAINIAYEESKLLREFWGEDVHHKIALYENIDDLTPEQLTDLVKDAIYLEEVCDAWAEPEQLLKLAKQHGIDAKAIRAELEPKPKAKAKKEPKLRTADKPQSKAKKKKSGKGLAELLGKEEEAAE